MAKYLALRRYPADFQTQCGHTVTNGFGAPVGSGYANPTAFYSGSGSGHTLAGAGNIGQCGADGCLAICPDCHQPIVPYRKASNSGRITIGGQTLALFSGQCHSTCPGILAKGIQATAQASSPIPPPGSYGPARQVQIPTQTHKGIAPADPDRRAAFVIKLRERVRQGIYTAQAQGHSMNGVAVVDLDSAIGVMRDKCSVCAADLAVGLREFSDPPYTGTAVAFPCKLMAKGRKP